jgi:hypothetical protein
MHRAGPFDELNHRRDMRRTSMREETTVQASDDQFTDLSLTAGIDTFGPRGSNRSQEP